MTDAYVKVMAEREGHNENSDCTVIALSIVLAIPYDVAHSMLADAGRRNRRGFGLLSWLRVRREVNHCGYKVTTVSCGRLQDAALRLARPWAASYTYPTLAQVQRDFPKGRFIVRKARHVFAMIDGVIHDSCGPRTRITDIALFERT